MVRFSSFGLVIASLIALRGNSFAETLYHHGSVMELMIQNDESPPIIITYVVPSSQMAGLVTPGTVLFQGKYATSQSIVGKLRVFSKNCGSVFFSVTGAESSQGFTFVGSQPVRNSQCKVVGKKNIVEIFSRYFN